MRPDTNAGRPQRTMKVLSLGPPRSGSWAMTDALEILGYPEIYHMYKTPWLSQDYDFFNSASDRFFPSLPTYKPGSKITREEWDTVLGTWEGVADVGGCFSTSLIEAYPEAKVVLVHRPFEKWVKSWIVLMEVLSLSTPLSYFNYWVAEPLIGSNRTSAVRKIATGFAGARDWSEVCDVNLLRDHHDRHYKEIRRVVPKDRLLEIELSDLGWEKLCEFLGKPVPDVPFPNRNTSAELQIGLPMVYWRNLKWSLKDVVLPWTVSGAVAAAGVWIARSKGLF